LENSYYCLKKSFPKLNNSNVAFFDNYPSFYETSKTSPFPNRLNHRYSVLIEKNKKIIENSSILDLGSHDGRWSFAALKNGAKSIYGIEGRDELVQNSESNMKKYAISSENYRFVCGDIFQKIRVLETKSFDIVFCFGLFYHVIEHMTLLSEIKRISRKYLILDTSISTDNKPIIELREEDTENESNAIRQYHTANKIAVVGYPSKAALEIMLKNLAYENSFLDWHNMGITNWDNLEDYRQNKRVSLIARIKN